MTKLKFEDIKVGDVLVDNCDAKNQVIAKTNSYLIAQEGCDECVYNSDLEWVIDSDFYLVDYYKEPKDFVPKIGGEYWFVVDDGDATRTRWEDDSYDNYRLSQGNVFRTEAEAQTYKEKVLDVEGKLRAIAREFPVDWSEESQDKYPFVYDHEDGVLRQCCDCIWQRQGGTIYLTEEGKDKALAEIGEEALTYMILNKR